jgi:hypothetical protein
VVACVCVGVMYRGLCAYVCVCVCERERARVRVCSGMHVRWCHVSSFMRVCMCVCVRVDMYIHVYINEFVMVWL